MAVAGADPDPPLLQPPLYDAGGPARIVMIPLNMDGTRDPSSTSSGAGGPATTHEGALRPLVKGARKEAFRFPPWFRFSRLPIHSNTWFRETRFPLISNPVSNEIRADPQTWLSINDVLVQGHPEGPESRRAVDTDTVSSWGYEPAWTGHAGRRGRLSAGATRHLAFGRGRACAGAGCAAACRSLGA